MYLSHFGFREEPFALTTDPRFLFLSPAHAQAQACLDFAVMKGDGIVVITGTIGAGKSLLAHDVAERAGNEVVVVHNTRVGANGLFREALSELGHLDIPETKAELLIALRRELASRFQSGTRTLLIVDEAQHLDAEALEDLRMLADEQVNCEKPMSVVLVGQPSLAATLQGPGLEQVRQRIRLHFHLSPLTLDDTERYLAYRCGIARKDAPSKPVGGPDPVYLFERGAVVVIHRYTGGVPRLINVVADLGLMTAWLDSTRLVTATMIEAAVKDLGWVPYRRRRNRESNHVRIVAARPGVPAMLQDVFGSPLEALRDAYRSRPNWGAVRNRAASLRAACIDRAGGAWHALRDRLDGINAATQPSAQGWGQAILKSDSARQVVAWSVVAVSVVLLLTQFAVPGRWSAGADAQPVGNAAAMADGAPVASAEFASAELSGDRLVSQEPQFTAMLDPTPLYTPETSVPTAADRPVAALPDNRAVAGSPASPDSPSLDDRTGASVIEPDLAQRPAIDLPSTPWLLEQPPESYVIQVFATHEPANLSRFAETQALDQMAYYHRRRDGEDWYVLLAGQYPSYEVARTASADLPDAVRRSKPWIRKMEVVQTDIRETGVN